MSKGKRYRTGLRIFNLGVRLKWVWLMGIGDRIKRSGLEEYV